MVSSMIKGTVGVQIAVHDRFRLAKRFQADEWNGDIVEEVNLAKGNGGDIWKCISLPIPDRTPRNVYVCIDAFNPHTSLAVVGNETSIVFHIVGERMLKLRPDLYDNAESIQRFLSTCIDKHTICQTRLSDRELAMLALWCKPNRYRLITGDCSAFAGVWLKK